MYLRSLINNIHQLLLSLGCCSRTSEEIHLRPIYSPEVDCFNRKYVYTINYVTNYNRVCWGCLKENIQN